MVNSSQLPIPKCATLTYTHSRVYVPISSAFLPTVLILLTKKTFNLIMKNRALMISLRFPLQFLIYQDLFNQS